MLELSPSSYIALIILAAAGIWWWRRQQPGTVTTSPPPSAMPAPTDTPLPADELYRRLARLEAKVDILLAQSQPRTESAPQPTLDDRPLRDTVYHLYDEGHDVSHIAEILHVSCGEVALVLQLRTPARG
jgi:hypothetical protein